MPNRIIKESICTSDNLNNLTAEEERFFYRLIVKCDDFGRYDGRPQVLRAGCYPLKVDIVKDKDITKWLNALIREGLVILYETKGRKYIQMTTWDDHQQKRATKSKYPDPETIIQSNDITCNQKKSNVPVFENVFENVNDIYAQKFNDFWKAYPKKRSKGDAEKAWKKLKPNEQLHNRIMKSLEQAKTSVDWTKEGGKYIPYPATWLRAKGWEDVIEPVSTSKPPNSMDDPIIRRAMELERERNAQS